MQNADLLKLPPKDTKLFSNRIDKIAGITGIKIDILSLVENVLTVRVEQVDLKNGWILNQDELSYKAKQIFKEMPQYKVNYIPLTYQPKFETITKDWIKSKMKEFKLKQTDLVKHFGIDKATLSTILNDENRSITRFQKSAFYFYFLNFEMNRDFRNYLNNVEKEGKSASDLNRGWFVVAPAKVVESKAIDTMIGRAATNSHAVYRFLKRGAGFAKVTGTRSATAIDKIHLSEKNEEIDEAVKK